ncbi:MAG: type II secretion system F family protein [Coriobacteriia bacterium]|nr:type II secretion system F family protein [Coriobacteriia bacterium]
MAGFTYTVRDYAGKTTKGKIQGENKEAVSARLSQMGYVVLSVKPQSGFASLNNITIGSGIKSKDVTIFSRQFATMINAGLSLTKCLSILAAQTENAYLRQVIAQLGKDVEAGQSLSDALSRHPKVFPPIFVSMVKAGETGGVLDQVLARVADHFEQEASLKGKVKSAMTYPVAMGGLVLVVLALMMIFVVPTFQKMFEDMGGDLPFMTQVLVNISSFVVSWSGAIAAVVAIGLIFVIRWWCSGPGKFFWDQFCLNAPVFGSLVRKIAVARFTRTAGTLVSAGVPILTTLEIVADTSGNEVIARAVMRARSAIKEGETIAKPLSESKVFPSMVTQMIAVGEETGALDAMLEKIADFYDDEVGSAVDGLTSLIEPLMMATLGVIVGSMVVALYLPMFTVITLIN